VIVPPAVAAAPLIVAWSLMGVSGATALCESAVVSVVVPLQWIVARAVALWPVA